MKRVAKTPRRKVASPGAHRWHFFLARFNSVLGCSWKRVTKGSAHMPLADVLAYGTPRLFGDHEWGCKRPPNLRRRRRWRTYKHKPRRPACRSL